MKIVVWIAVWIYASTLMAQDTLPPIDKYMMVKENGQWIPAHWLGALYNGKTIQEPINVIIQDSISKTSIEAQTALLDACVKAGFSLRMGHSSGYAALIDGKTIEQFSPKPNHAFSDAPFEINNNHGRIFGPVSRQKTFLFVAALSREDVAPLRKVKHQYDSFNRARDRFAEAMNDTTSYKKVRFVNLDNAILQSTTMTTGDHDGIAILLERK